MYPIVNVQRLLHTRQMHTRAGIGICVLFAQAVYPQATVLKGYKTHEDYCRDNPKAPTCIKGKPLNIDALNPKLQGSPGGARTPAPVAPAAPQMIVLGEPDWRFAHPRADLMAAMDVTGMIRSPFFRTLLSDLGGTGGIGNAEMESLLARADDVEKISISAHGKEILILMTGRLDSIENLAKPGSGMTFHRVSADSILMGTEPALSEAMRRLSVPQRTVSNAARRAKELSQTNDLWMTGTPALLTAYGASGPRGMDLSSFTIGLQLRDQLRMDLVLNSTTPAGAQRMMAGYQQAQRKTSGALQSSVTLDGSAVRLAFVLPQGEIRKGLQELMSSAAGKQLAALIAANKPAAGDSAAKPPAAPGKVMIYGLEGGPKEVPIQKP